MITPELPRAPISAPRLDGGGDPLGRRVAAGQLRLVERGPDGRDHVRARVAVRDREDVQGVDLVDVLPRGSRRRSGSRRAARRRCTCWRTIRRRPCRWRRDRRSATAAGSRVRRRRGDDRRVRCDPQAVDVDRRAARPRDRGRAGRRSGRPSRPGGRPPRSGGRGRRGGRARSRAPPPRSDGDPARGEPEPLGEAAERAAAGEADHAVRAERRAADDVDDRAPAHERTAGGRGRRIGGHAAGILPRRLDPPGPWRGARRGCYHTAPPAPSGRRRPRVRARA